MFASLLLASVTSVTSAPIQPNPIVAGYLPAWKFDSFNPNQLDHLTDLIYFSTQPKADGTLDLKDVNPAHLKTLTELKGKHKFRLLVCIGGWERSAHFTTVSTDPNLRQAFIQNLANFATEHNLDGIDLDWEHPKNEEESAAYANLIIELKEKIKPKLVTAALASWQSLPKKGWDNLDRLHLMSYDHQGPHSTLANSKEDVTKVMAQGIPAAKIALGVPFYGRSLKNPNDAKTYAELLPALKQDTKSDEINDFYFNNIQTIKAKVNFAKTQNLAGIMIWEITQDTNGPRSLLTAIQESLKTKPQPSHPKPNKQHLPN